MCRRWGSCSCSTISSPRPESRRSGFLQVRRSSSQITEPPPKTSRRARQIAARRCFSACSALDQLSAYTPSCTAHRQAGSECRETPNLGKGNKLTKQKCQLKVHLLAFSGDFNDISWSFSGYGACSVVIASISNISRTTEQTPSTEKIVVYPSVLWITVCVQRINFKSAKKCFSKK